MIKVPSPLDGILYHPGDQHCDMSLWEFLEYVNWGGKNYPKHEQHHSVGLVSDWIKKEKTD